MDYQEDLTEKQLKIGYWYLTHKAILNKYLVIFLIVLNIVLWGYSGYRWVMYYIETPSYEKMIAEMPKDLINWKDFHEKHQPQPLQVIETTAISLGKGKYDLVAKIENPNIHWMVEDFKYQFSLGGSLKETKESFVLPGEAKFLIDLGVRGAGEANVIFKDIDWFRISKFEILKDILVDLLYQKRGKYTRPFMHFGTIGLVFLVIVFQLLRQRRFLALEVEKLLDTLWLTVKQ